MDDIGRQYMDTHTQVSKSKYTHRSTCMEDRVSACTGTTCTEYRVSTCLDVSTYSMGVHGSTCSYIYTKGKGVHIVTSTDESEVKTVINGRKMRITSTGGTKIYKT